MISGRSGRKACTGLLAAAVLGGALLTAGAATAGPSAFVSIAPWQPTTAALVLLAHPVSAVGQDGMVVRERDSGRVVPGLLQCKNGGTDVPCTAATITAVWLLPTRAFTFGQYYRVSFAPRLHAAANRPLLIGSTDFRAGSREEDQSANPNYSWATRGNSNALGGSYSVESGREARASLTFSGTSVTVWTATSPTGGLMDVYVDQVLRAEVNTYSRATRFRVPVTVSGLSRSAHRLDVAARGAKGSSASAGTDVVLDAVSSPQAFLTTPVLEYTWSAAFSARFSEGWASSSSSSGARVSLQFRGTAVDLATVRGPWSGIFRATLDGRTVGDFNDGAAGFGVGVRRFTAKGDTLHTLTLTVLGTHSRASSGSAVTVDYWSLPSTPVVAGSAG